MADVFLCDRLGLTEKELNETSDDWIFKKLILQEIDAKILATKQPKA